MDVRTCSNTSTGLRGIFEKKLVRQIANGLG